MKSIFAWGLFALVGMVLNAGCSAGGRNYPLLPSYTSENSSALTQSTSSEQQNHYIWGYYMVRVDERDLSAEIVPIRATAGHLNVLQFLEQGPCTNCFKLQGITPGPGGTLNVNISVKHPFANLNLTGFDVRAIAMFNGSHQFPTSGLVMSDRVLGEGEVLNADGYTALYNSTTAGNGLEGYFPEKLGSSTAPNSTLNGFKRLVTDNPANTRNAFYAGDEILATCEIDPPDPPSPLIFGYAVDACWTPAISKPVDDPMTDFGLDANCPEPWKVAVTEEPIGDGLTDQGGQTKLLIDVYDWQGKTTHHDPAVECPELFDGSLPATWLSDGLDYARYEVTVSNTKLAPIGEYRCLVGVEANENDPAAKPWLDLTAYQFIDLAVTSGGSGAGNLLWAKSAGGASGNEWGYGITTLPNDSTVVTGWFEGSATFGPGEPNETILTSAGFIDFFIARYGSDGTLTWAKSAGGADDERGYGITKLSDDSTVVTGWFEGTAVFGLDEPNQTVLISAGYNDIFIAHYNTDGTLAWAKSAGGSTGSLTYSEGGYGITTLSDDSTVVTGLFGGSVTFGPGDPNQTILTSAGNSDIFIARYDLDGILVWAKRAGGLDDEMGYGITTGVTDSTVVTGTYYGSATFGPGEAYEEILTSEGSEDIFVARYDFNGDLTWASSAGGLTSDQGYGITKLSDNSTVITGGFTGSATFGPGEVNQTVLTAAGDSDIFIARYGADGNLAWAKRAGALYDDYGRGVTTLLSDNSTVITGTFAGSATFGPGEPNQTVLTAAGWDIFIARYNPDGTLAWAKYAEGATGSDEGDGITTLSDNSTVATGFFVGSDTFGPGEPNQTILISAGFKDLFIARFHE